MVNGTSAFHFSRNPASAILTDFQDFRMSVWLLTFVSALSANASSSFSTQFSRLFRRESLHNPRFLSLRPRRLHRRPLGKMSRNQAAQRRMETLVEEPSAKPRISYPVLRDLTIKYRASRPALGLLLRPERPRLCPSRPLPQALNLFLRSPSLRTVQRQPPRLYRLRRHQQSQHQLHLQSSQSHRQRALMPKSWPRPRLCKTKRRHSWACYGTRPVLRRD